MVSIVNINECIKKPTRGHLNCNTSQVLLFDGMSRWENLCVPELSFVSILLCSILMWRPNLPRFEGSCIVYRSEWYHKEMMPDRQWYIPPHNIAQFNFMSFVAARVAGFELPHMFAVLWCHVALALRGTGHMCSLFEFVAVARQQRKIDETEFQEAPTSDPLHQHFLQVSIPATGYVTIDKSSN